MKKIQWAALASLSAAVGTVALSSTNRSDASSTSSTPGASSAAEKPAPPASAPSTGEFRASEFEGVSVRERPASTSGTSGKSTPRGWIALKPGEPRWVPGEAASRGFRVVRREKGTTPRGGDKLVGAGLMHAQIATRDAQGRVKMACVPGESKAAHAAHKAAR